MNLFSKVLIFISCILAFTTLFFFFRFVAVSAYNKDLLAQKEAFSLEAQKRSRLVESQSARTLDAERNAEKVLADATERLAAANELKAQLQRRLAESELAHKESIARLNARLEREILSTTKAEKDAEKYLMQKEALEHDLLMFWAEMETLKSEHKNKFKDASKKAEADKQALLDEIEKLRQQLKKADTSIQTLSSEKNRAQEEILTLKKLTAPAE